MVWFNLASITWSLFLCQPSYAHLENLMISFHKNFKRGNECLKHLEELYRWKTHQFSFHPGRTKDNKRTETELNSSLVPPRVWAVAKTIHKTHFSGLYRHVKHDWHALWTGWLALRWNNPLHHQKAMATLVFRNHVTVATCHVWSSGMGGGPWVGISEGRLAHGWVCQNGSKRLSETCRPEFSTPRWVACKTGVALLKYTYLDVGSLSFFFLVIWSGKTAFCKLSRKGEFLHVWSRECENHIHIIGIHIISVCIHWPVWRWTISGHEYSLSPPSLHVCASNRRKALCQSQHPINHHSTPPHPGPAPPSPADDVHHYLAKHRRAKTLHPPSAASPRNSFSLAGHTRSTFLVRQE